VTGADAARPGDDAALAEQVRYYRERAPEYDDWFLRRGRYDRGPEATAAWEAEVAEVAAALERFGARGRVLELAGGTGWWTARLAATADELTVVDAAPEVLARNRARVGDPTVRYVEADLFSWRPDRTWDARSDPTWDVVAFTFFLSHVPPERFEGFWAMVRACLAPGGRVFFADSRHVESSTSVDQDLPPAGATTAVRRLEDGREYTIVKVFHKPAALERRLAALGWHATVRATPTYFVVGEAAPAP